jgi:serine/threonine-protein kinase
MKEPFDFSFLSKYGKVFKIYDAQDSGNICFGVADGEKRYFVKFAGAPTASYKGNSEDAIARLKDTIPIYKELAHPSLIEFINAEAIGNGFAVIFAWVDAICAQRMYPEDYRKFKELSLSIKHRIFEDIMGFHAYVAAKGYVAIDFYDGSIMWDTINERSVICDIDFYQKAPYFGDMGLWGSTRFISPEERSNGAIIDEVTNVYTMGATAFVLFADSDRSLEAWPLKKALYNIVKRAVSDERSNRQQSIKQLMKEWKAAI